MRWVLSNIKEPQTKQPLVKAEEYIVLELQYGLRIGIIGLAEDEWFEVVSAFPSDLLYEDYLACASRLARLLKSQLSCHLVIALTHMRLPRDQLLSQSVPGIFLFFSFLFHFLLYFHLHFFSSHFFWNTFLFSLFFLNGFPYSRCLFSFNK